LAARPQKKNAHGQGGRSRFCLFLHPKRSEYGDIWGPFKKQNNMIISTTSSLDQRPAKEYHGLVAGETIIGANLFRDFFASIRDVVGGRAGSYERVLKEAKDTAIREMEDKARALGGNAVIGVDLDYETIGDKMLMVVASGTAVTI